MLERRSEYEKNYRKFSCNTDDYDDGERMLIGSADRGYINNNCHHNHNRANDRNLHNKHIHYIENAPHNNKQYDS